MRQKTILYSSCPCGGGEETFWSVGLLEVVLHAAHYSETVLVDSQSRGSTTSHPSDEGIVDTPARYSRFVVRIRRGRVRPARGNRNDLPSGMLQLPSDEEYLIQHVTPNNLYVLHLYNFSIIIIIIRFVVFLLVEEIYDFIFRSRLFGKIDI